MAATKTQVVLVSGISGAGLTVALNSLADLGFYSVDNLPVGMILPTIEALIGNAAASEETKNAQRLAFGVRLRSAEGARRIMDLIEANAAKFDFELGFLTSESASLINRYSSTRRPHPLLGEGNDIKQAILDERENLRLLEDRANFLLDTTDLTAHDLARRIEARYADVVAARKLNVAIASFGFKYGQYRPLDTMFDVRFLSNPYFVPELRNKTGLDQDVSDYVLEDRRSGEFLDKVTDLHRWLIPQYYNEGKHYFNIGIGCTGGQHRSVAMAEELAKNIRAMNLENITLSVSHRDAGKQPAFNPAEITNQGTTKKGTTKNA